ncbi:MAG: outer membrane beta-barrel protein [Xanthobacteraceae bacterium]|nr:outer membrane beta-barrel protein [Xanthobacteraceae bacterium]
MKKIALQIAALSLALAGSASAADLRAPVKGPVAVGPAFNCAAGQFGGWHVGIQGGSVYHQANREDTDGLLTDNAGWTMNKWGGHVGGQVGYDFTTCSTVWGVEVDGAWVFGTKNFLPDNPGTAGTTDGINTRMNWLATARVRSGVALDNLLIYATGGVAAARFRTTWVDGTDIADIKETRWGWVAGIGTEWAWSRNVSFKFETLYVGFTDRDHRSVLPGGTFTFVHSDSAWISRVGLNYRWGAPVVARY